ncbi:MAG TPA: hypothetical protein VGE72_28495 [Azospirillum sp.]
MAVDRRNVDKNDLDAMTRDYLSKGGKIVQCPPGSSENVVYKRNSFRRRPGSANGNTEGAPPAEGAPPTEAAPAEPAPAESKDQDLSKDQG